MANDNKINNVIIESKKIFLPDDIFGDDVPKKVYSLSDEFEKTRRNKSFKFYFIILVFLFATFGSAYLFTKYIQRSNKIVSFEMTEFVDLHLRELLSSNKKTYEQLKIAKRELENLKIAKQKRIIRVKDNSAIKRKEIYTKRLLAKRRTAELKKIKQSELRQIKLVNNKYNALIRKKQTQINDIQKKIDEYDMKLSQATKRAEELVNNMKTLYKIKLEKERKKYLSLLKRYNPSFKGDVRKAVYREDIALLKDKLEIPAYPIDFFYEDILSEDEYVEINNLKDDFNIIINRLEKIPYKKSVRTALQKIDYLNKTIISKYDKLWNRMLDRIHKKNIRLSYFYNAFNFRFSEMPEAGLVLDSRDSVLRLIMNPFYDIGDSSRAKLFRNDDQMIGEVIITKDETGYYASIVSINSNFSPKPFDKVFIFYK